MRCRTHVQRIERFFATERGAPRLALLALLWSSPALALGLQTDDHLMRWAVGYGAPTWELYHLDAEFRSTRAASGFFPWWTSPAYGVSFFRPLSSLSHALEFALYPRSPALMLFVNVLLYGATVMVAASLYRRLLPAAGTAALAGLMFALDEGHALSVGWIAGRNTLLAALFSLLALHFHLRDGRRRSIVLSTACVALALLSAEAGLWSLAFLLSAAFTRDAVGARVALRFSFRTPLESPERVWLDWEGSRPVRFQPPALGERVRLAPLDLARAFAP